MRSLSCPSVLRQVRRTFQRPRIGQDHRLARLLSTLAILEQREGQLQIGSLGTVTAASKLGGPITGFIAGSAGRKVAEEAAKAEGLDKVIYVENGAYDKVERIVQRQAKLSD